MTATTGTKHEPTFKAGDRVTASQDVNEKYAGKDGTVLSIHGDIYPFHYRVAMDGSRDIVLRGDEMTPSTH